MRRRFLVVFCSILLVLVAAASGAWAQTDVFVTPIPNAPFSGVINVERSFVQGDGSIVGRKTIREIGRDSRGRIFNEYRQLLPPASTETPQVTHVLVYDPQTRFSTTLFPQQRTFRTGIVNRPPETVPPALTSASTTGSSLPQNRFTKEEDLGTHEIEGLPAHGVRATQTIPAENNATDKEIVVTDEFWYSEDLRINLVIKHNDPRAGSVSMTVTQIKRTEPDPSRFEIPEGYTVAGASQERKE